MTSAIDRFQGGARQAQSFVDRNFAEIAFLISSIALLVFAPLKLMIGAFIGYMIHSYREPGLKTSQVVTLENTLYTIVGGMAAVIRLTPAGATAGFVFNAIPLVASAAVGSTLYRFERARS